MNVAKKGRLHFGYHHGALLAYDAPEKTPCDSDDPDNLNEGNAVWIMSV
jgi:hypothetical protein